MKSNFTHSPGGIVAHTDAISWGLDDDLLDDGRKDLGDDGFKDGEARDGHVTEKSVSGLSDGGFVVLWQGQRGIAFTLIY